MKLSTTIAAMAVLANLIFTHQPRAAELSPTQLLSADNNDFACELYGHLKDRDGNLFFSPYSISACLAMTYNGARGETARQMAHTLHFNSDPVALAAPFGTLQKSLQADAQKNGFELAVANGLWAEQSHRFEPSFIKLATKQYGARLEQVDFKTGAEPARKEINSWVSKQTKDKINDLIPAGAVDSQTLLVLVNAIYFKGSWANPFKENRTFKAPFTVSPRQKVQAKMMRQDGRFGYGETNNVQLLEMKYLTGDSKPGSAQLSMIVLLPRTPDDLAKLEKSLNAAALDSWLSQMHPQRVDVFLPKFKTTDQFSLSQTLSDMGMKDAFSYGADFSGMDGQRDLFISAVIHKAYVDVNEEGTEAAAATSVTMAAAAVMRPNIVFRADHPFLFLIRDMESGSILFMGRLNDPTK